MKLLLNFILIIMVLGTFPFSIYAEPEENYQAEAIFNGDMSSAENQLLAVLEKNPNDPYALLNLAFVYQKAGDQDKARAIYYRILALRNNPYAELASGESERVKSIAQRGIERVEIE